MKLRIGNKRISYEVAFCILLIAFLVGVIVGLGINERSQVNAGNKFAQR